MRTHPNVNEANEAKIDRPTLRQFGLVVGLVVASVFGIFFPLLRRHSSPTWSWVVASILIFLGLLAPSTLRPIYLVWMRIGHVIGAIETRLVLGIIFYCLITPMALVMRMFGGYDPMKQKLHPNQPSYRQKSEIKPANRMENPY